MQERQHSKQHMVGASSNLNASSPWSKTRKPILNTNKVIKILPRDITIQMFDIFARYDTGYDTSFIRLQPRTLERPFLGEMSILDCLKNTAFIVNQHLVHGGS